MSKDHIELRKARFCLVLFCYVQPKLCAFLGKLQNTEACIPYIKTLLIQIFLEEAKIFKHHNILWFSYFILYWEKKNTILSSTIFLGLHLNSIKYIYIVVWSIFRTLHFVKWKFCTHQTTTFHATPHSTHLLKPLATTVPLLSVSINIIIFKVHEQVHIWFSKECNQHSQSLICIFSCKRWCNK